MNIRKFAVDYNVIGMAFGTIIGLGLTNWVREFRETIKHSQWYKQYGPDEKYGTMISATLEIIILLTILYLTYQYIVRPVVRSELEAKDKRIEADAEFKQNVTNNIQKLDSVVKNIDRNIKDLNDRDKKKRQIE